MLSSHADGIVPVYRYLAFQAAQGDVVYNDDTTARILELIKKAILHRKDSLSYRTRRGAFVGDLYMSLIQTCLLCTADPFDYLTQILRNHEQAARAPEQWMPLDLWTL